MTEGRQGLLLYAKCYAAIGAAPLTAQEVSTAIGRESKVSQVVREILSGMVRGGIARIDHWRESPHRSSFMLAAFVAGGGQSAPYPRPINRPVPGGRTKRCRANLFAFVQIIRMLSGGATRMEIHKETGVALHRLPRIFRVLRAAGMLHIASWDVSHEGKPSQVLKLGGGQDAPRPKPQAKKDIQRRSRQARVKREAMQRVIRAIAGEQAIVVIGRRDYTLCA